MTPSNKIRFSVLGAVLLGAAALVLVILSAGDSASTKEAEQVVRDGGVSVTGDKGRAPLLDAVRGPGEHELRGFVRGADGAPIGGASVTALMELGPGVRGGVPADAGPLASLAIVANSDAEGRFVLEGMPAGRYRLQVESPDILSAELRFVEAPGNDLQILVSRSLTVKGRVQDPAASVLGVKVYLQSEASTHRYQSLSDAGGSFSFTSIPEGRYKIFAVGVDRAAPVQLVSRLGMGPFAELVLRMQQAHSVQGRVVEAGGSQLGLVAEIRLRDVEGIEGERRTKSASDGSFAIHGVLPGRWIAEARSPGYLPSEAQSFAAESERALALALDAGASVSGVVLGPDRSPVQGAVLLLQGTAQDGTAKSYSQSSLQPQLLSSLLPGQRLLPLGELGVLLGPIPMPPPKGSLDTRVASFVLDEDATQSDPIEATESQRSIFVTDERGRFRISGVEAGEYRLLVAHEVWADSGTAAFRVRHGQALDGKRIQLQAGTRLGGQVSDDRGVPVIGASIIVQFQDGREPALSVSDAEGSFEFTAMTGTVEVVVEALGHERVSQVHRLAKGSLAAVEKRLQFRLARADAYIEGRLVDSTGFSIRGAELRVEPGPRALPSRTRHSDDNGLFRLDGLPEGEHAVLVSHADYPDHRMLVSTGVKGDLVVPFGGGLAVDLRDQRTQSPLAMADLQLEPVPAKTGTLAPAVGNGKTERTLSDESGKARFVPIRAGSYLLRTQKQGYAAVQQPIDLKAGQRIGEITRELVVELVRGATIAGILRDSKGDRFVGATLSVGLVSTISDKEGRFRLSDVPSGTIYVRIEKGDESSEKELTLEAGEERVTLELVHSTSSSAPREPEPSETAPPEPDEDDEDDEE